MKTLLSALLLSALLTSARAGAAVITRPLTLDFAGTPARAELVLPDEAVKAPLVLLIQGTGPEDMNGSFPGYGGDVVKGSLGTLAHTLAAQGFAVMRFDKRGAAAAFDPQTAQAAQAAYAQRTMRDLLADAHTALNAARAQLGVDASRVYIYGWSEGSVVAASLALEVGARGLIVQGPVVNSFAATFTRQFERVGLPYLTRYARNGKLGLADLMASFQGDGSPMAKMQGQLLFDRTSTLARPVLSTFLDNNHDGLIDLLGEALPAIAAYDSAAVLQSPMYAPATSLPPLGTLAPQLTLPVLILQGAVDANIDPADAQALDTALAKAGNTDHTLKVYAGLGHSLGRATSVTQDYFAPMAPEPVNDLAAWLKRH
ncbi:alpha/beta hydrolase family protein [Deinococcus hopiensis]|uniref:Serine aminopeptidase S33 domain-containing protein n=1 Tax=Deinococcus hopiensis KR-140 TaxID=695939 RepID=A0A1W1VV42_9DEIO|nr:alpha/beta hydrolase [Deinococcus hopiensis]SMB97090.1 hypothetical protein SAMN00790413_06335 [Deinococcus hopiensis KR-140]